MRCHSLRKHVLMPSEDENIVKDPQFDVILSNFQSSKDYALLLTCIVLRGPSDETIKCSH